MNVVDEKRHLEINDTLCLLSATYPCFISCDASEYFFTHPEKPQQFHVKNEALLQDESFSINKNLKY